MTTSCCAVSNPNARSNIFKWVIYIRPGDCNIILASKTREMGINSIGCNIVRGRIFLSKACLDKIQNLINFHLLRLVIKLGTLSIVEKAPLYLRLTDTGD